MHDWINSIKPNWFQTSSKMTEKHLWMIDEQPWLLLMAQNKYDHQLTVTQSLFYEYEINVILFLLVGAILSGSSHPLK